MSFFTVNHEEAGTGFKPLEPGEYEVIVTKAEPTVTKESKLPMLNLEFTVRDNVDQNGQKRKIFDRLVFSDKTKWRVQQASKAFGIETGREFETLEDFKNEILYTPVRVKIDHREYNDKTYEEVKQYMETQHPMGKLASNSNPFEGAPAVNDEDLPF